LRETTIETAVVRTSNNILSSSGRGKVAALLLLDLSAAFDTMDHQILLSRLQTDMGPLCHGSHLISLVASRLFPVQGVLLRLFLSCVASHSDRFWGLFFSAFQRNLSNKLFE